MEKLILIAIVGLMFSCKDETNIQLETNDKFLYTVVYDSCEYVESNYTMNVFEHKGNCKNPIHYGNNSN